jgi:hypothetical protein
MKQRLVTNRSFLPAPAKLSMTSAQTFRQPLLISLIAAAALAACGGGDNNTNNTTPAPAPIPEVPAPAPEPEKTPTSLTLEKIGSYQSGIFLQSAAEITAFDPVTKRGFVVNAQKGALDVLDMSNPAAPRMLASLDATKLSLGAGPPSTAWPCMAAWWLQPCRHRSRRTRAWSSSMTPTSSA